MTQSVCLPGSPVLLRDDVQFLPRHHRALGREHQGALVAALAARARVPRQAPPILPLQLRF